MKKTRFWKKVAGCLGVAFLFFMVFGAISYGEDVNELIREAGKTIRESKKQMFRGNKEEALKILNRASEMIEKIDTMDPDNPKLKSLKNKYTRQEKDLQKRMGKVEKKSAGPGKPTQKQDKKAKKVPYHARNVLKEMDGKFRRIEGALKYMEEAKTREPFNWSEIERRFENIEKILAELPGDLADAKDKAAEEGVLEHPKFVEYAGRIKEADNRYQAKKAEMIAFKDNREKKSMAVGEDVESFLSVVKPHEDKIRLYNIGVNFMDPNADFEKMSMTFEEFQKFTEKELPKIQAAYQDFAKKYGKTEREVENSLDQAGFSGKTNPKYLFAEIQTLFDRLPVTRKKTADFIVQSKVDEKLEPARIDSVHDFHKMKYLGGDFEKLLQMALKIDPDNESAKASLLTLDKRIAEAKERFMKKVDKVTWPDHASSAPKDSGKLAKVAREFLEELEKNNTRKKDTETRKVIAVVVTGPWSVQKRNILGEPVMYGLPVLAASVLKSEKKDNFARVYSLTLRTLEKKDAEPKPPFGSVTVGNSYYIRRDKL